jgi:tRNA threonylcarbamoyladenosine biosynthesis protein TsaE
MLIEANLESLSNVVDTIKRKLSSHTVVILRGTLASGKTTLTKALVKALGCDESVTSPTFSIQQVYGESIYHYDVYNKDINDFISMGFLEEIDKEGIHIIEWADERLEALLKEYGFDVLLVEIEIKEKRVYRISDV